MSNALGDVLVAQGVIDQAILEEATAVQSRHGGTLARALVHLGAATERQIVQAVARQTGMQYADCSPGHPDPDAAALLPRAIAREIGALPVAFTPGNGLLVAVVDPSNHDALARITALTGMPAEPALAVRSELESAIEHLADPSGEPSADEMTFTSAFAPSPNGNGAANGNGHAATNGNGHAAGNNGHANGAAPAVGNGNGNGNGHVAAALAEPAGDTELLEFERSSTLDLDAVLRELIDRSGSDLHLTVGVTPTIRVHGELTPLSEFPVLAAEDIRQAVYGILTQRQREEFENELELDCSYSIPGEARFRVNVFQQRNSIGVVMRVIPFEIQHLNDLGIPPRVADFATLPRGFVLVTGPTGSGKSTTLAALIDMINRERPCHIMTVEDPIEFLHNHKRSVVNQRELGTDTRTFGQALKHVLRQDPDVILVGEMRDLETIQVALTAAETGHLVFGTLHTQDAPQTVDRIIDVFPPHQQEQIRVMLAGSLQGVVCQQLMKTADGRGRVAASEVMIANSAIRNLIREGKTHQMYSTMQAGKAEGMLTMDQSLANLVIAGKITFEHGLDRCHHPADFTRLCGRG